MAVRPPGKDELAAIARGYGMHLSDEDLGSFEPMVAGLLSSYDAVEELYAQIAPEAPAGRTWKRPDRGRTRWAPGTCGPRSRTGRTDRWPGAGSRSRTTSRSPACR